MIYFIVGTIIERFIFLHGDSAGLYRTKDIDDFNEWVPLPGMAKMLINEKIYTELSESFDDTKMCYCKGVRGYILFEDRMYETKEISEIVHCENCTVEEYIEKFETPRPHVQVFDQARKKKVRVEYLDEPDSGKRIALANDKHEIKRFIKKQHEKST